MKAPIAEDFKMKCLKLFVKLGDYKIEHSDIISLKNLQKNAYIFFGEKQAQK